MAWFDVLNQYRCAGQARVKSMDSKRGLDPRLRHACAQTLTSSQVLKYARSAKFGERSCLVHHNSNGTKGGCMAGAVAEETKLA